MFSLFVLFYCFDVVVYLFVCLCFVRFAYWLICCDSWYCFPLVLFNLLYLLVFLCVCCFCVLVLILVCLFAFVFWVVWIGFCGLLVGCDCFCLIFLFDCFALLCVIYLYCFVGFALRCCCFTGFGICFGLLWLQVWCFCVLCLLFTLLLGFGLLVVVYVVFCLFLECVACCICALLVLLLLCCLLLLVAYGFGLVVFCYDWCAL